MSLSTLEIICAPYTIWLADVGTAFPDVDTAPAAGWTKLGASGDKNYNDQGVIVGFEEQLGTFTPAGGTGERKVWRVSEKVTVGAEIADLTASLFAKLHNDATVTQTAPGAGTAGTDSVPLLKGTDVALFAALVRGASPVDPTMSAQYQIPIVYNSDQRRIAYAKSAAFQAVNLMTLEDDTLGFGEYIVQTADAS